MNPLFHFLPPLCLLEVGNQAYVTVRLFRLAFAQGEDFVLPPGMLQGTNK
jgi:hypothetical protein